MSFSLGRGQGRKSWSKLASNTHQSVALVIHEKLQGRHTCHAGAEMGTHRQHVAPSAESIQIRSCPSFMCSAMPINNIPKSIALEAALAVFLASSPETPSKLPAARIALCNDPALGQGRRTSWRME